MTSELKKPAKVGFFILSVPRLTETLFKLPSLFRTSPTPNKESSRFTLSADLFAALPTLTKDRGASGQYLVLEKQMIARLTSL